MSDSRTDDVGYLFQLKSRPKVKNIPVADVAAIPVKAGDKAIPLPSRNVTVGWGEEGVDEGPRIAKLSWDAAATSRNRSEPVEIRISVRETESGFAKKEVVAEASVDAGATSTEIALGGDDQSYRFELRSVDKFARVSLPVTVSLLAAEQKLPTTRLRLENSEDVAGGKIISLKWHYEASSHLEGFHIYRDGNQVTLKKGLGPEERAWSEILKPEDIRLKLLLLAATVKFQNGLDHSGFTSVNSLELDC